MKTIEYRVRPVTRNIVTRYHDDGNGSCGVETCGEFDGEDQAEKVAMALAKAEPEGRVTFTLGEVLTACRAGQGGNGVVHRSYRRQEVVREE